MMKNWQKPGFAFVNEVIVILDATVFSVAAGVVEVVMVVSTGGAVVLFDVVVESPND